MAALNIRNIDPALLRRVKVEAARQRQTLKDWVTDVLEEQFRRRKKEAAVKAVDEIIARQEGMNDGA